LKLVLRKNMKIIQHIRENKSVYKKQTSSFFSFLFADISNQGCLFFLSHYMMYLVNINPLF
jgi:hypothetical protein